MKRFPIVVLAAALIAAALPATARSLIPIPPAKTLTAFKDEAELKDWLEKERKRQAPPGRRALGAMADSMSAQNAPALTSPAAPAAKAMAGTAKEESITNTQTVGVDEGGIVKVHGEHLVILRRGRLFTVAMGASLSPASYADAFGEGVDPRGAWYDEMLIHRNTVIVIGYSYARGGTEVGLFDIDRAGKLSHRGTYHLKSNDYYSSRNYASRLVGDKLVFYTPLYLNLHGDTLAGFPAMRKWSKDAVPADFKRIAPATRIYRTDDAVEGQGLTLHTVTSCDLAKRDMACEATGVLGPAGRVFYVSQENVFVWTTDHRRVAKEARSASAVFRMPLSGAPPTALKASGSPIDQFSFLESDGFLNVLVRSEGRGETMWSSESSAGSTALMRVSLDRFGNGTDAAPAEAYRKLPSPAGYTVQNRFVGSWLLYGSGSTWGGPNATKRNPLHAVRWDLCDAPQTISLPHGVDRIEALGRHALVVGTAGKDLLLSSVRLDDTATVAHRFTREDAAQGETRSHGFFYKPDTDDTGLLGLPVVGGGRAGHKQLRDGSAAVMFMRNDALMLGDIGELGAKATGTDDACKASCVDWYGNARPVFLRGRIFALLGYEIVEGRFSSGTINEVGRASFAPGAQRIARAP
ncbi:hypothetical protein DSM104443_01255 [Usitatibacter rugosus]|uniref:Beta propeller domain-containing protein n=1 Tax=Usitatibacter rugosus TaxID=2732067 RepID=A0A6M4GSH7_9PROT|nr:beta-propeller domain-containing protein [Usitatibacter rugosus]QJR10201.1 hypothetical protein DSM104443_01255 [Usitatibacter rugosus]